MDAIDAFLAWFTQPSNRLLMWSVIGVLAALLVTSLVSRLLSLVKVPYHADFPTETPAANLLALGFQPLQLSGSHWNDPNASTLTESEQNSLKQAWGLFSQKSAAASAEDLITNRAQRDAWQRWLGIRLETARTNGGRRPSSRQWIAAIAQTEEADSGSAFVRTVHYYEKRVRWVSRRVPAARAPIFNFDGYALGTAVALATWGVALGCLTREESEHLIAQANTAAREEFTSWGEFGCSYALGLAMVESNGTPDAGIARRAKHATSAMLSALDGRRFGPWGLLPWRP